MAIGAEDNQILGTIIFRFAPWFDVGFFKGDWFTAAGASVATLEQQISLCLDGDRGPVIHASCSVSFKVVSQLALQEGFISTLQNPAYRLVRHRGL